MCSDVEFFTSVFQCEVLGFCVPMWNFLTCVFQCGVLDSCSNVEF